MQNMILYTHPESVECKGCDKGHWLKEVIHNINLGEDPILCTINHAKSKDLPCCEFTNESEYENKVFECEDCHKNAKISRSINGAKDVCTKCYAAYATCSNCGGHFFKTHLDTNGGECSDCLIDS
jgi:hypothetical protein